MRSMRLEFTGQELRPYGRILREEIILHGSLKQALLDSPRAIEARCRLMGPLEVGDRNLGILSQFERKIEARVLRKSAEKAPKVQQAEAAEMKGDMRYEA